MNEIGITPLEGVQMEELFKSVASHVALGVETTAVLIVAFGAVQAVVRTLMLIGNPLDHGRLRSLWIHFGVWLLLGLQFAVAADIVRSAISPNWEEIGHLAAIAAIRTFLSYFLEKDLLELKARGAEAAPDSAS